MAQRRNGRKQARRDTGKSRGHGFVWFSAGLVSGLALATYAWFSGILPPQQPDSNLQSGDNNEPPAAEVAPAQDESPRKYDFYTVLPEMEVVVPEQEISQSQTPPTTRKQGPYFLQVGSFRKATDADSQKAKLALLGIVAQIKSVNVDGNTWHRVRVGPIESARETDAMRRRLEDNAMEAMVLRGQ